MRYLSRIFQPVITIPKNAKIKNTEITCKSQKLLLECGLVRPTTSGFFTLLPLARRALDKLENLIKTCIESSGAQRLSLPALTSAGLWAKTGRLENAAAELLTLEDRHNKKYLLAPTYEEAIAELLSDLKPISYKQLPIILYQISNKYRDELRPKHGLLRAREFSMLDAYGAHASSACALQVYGRMATAYEHLFRALHLKVHKVEAPSGDMGGSFSHEWQLAATSGEDQIKVCPSCSHAALLNDEGTRCQSCGKDAEILQSIEVGHTFILGTKYSEALEATYCPPSGPPLPIIMSCYGIGITRLLAASLEALSTEKALRWPKAIAPYSAIIIGPKEGSKEWNDHGMDQVKLVYDALNSVPALRSDVLVDDRHGLTIGKRLLMADKMGYPIVIACGKESSSNPPRYEVTIDGATQLCTAQELVQTLSDKYTHLEYCT
ncbi:probable proline--tRNA ligase, mitochondrial [Bombyx mandarina]|uniref:proline--tRNA ligase n=1 Tax=Bombyx mandarina TaxID=7092 RepID=A0A6J2K241_BOMMA|nr:probable proline--tRNA ligase, mitochondrial [Bombyx mandarina]